MRTSWPTLPRLRAILVFFVVFLATLQVLVIALSFGSIRLNRVGALLLLVVASALALLTSRRSEVGASEHHPGEASSIFSPFMGRFLLVATLAIFGVFVLLAYQTEDLSYDGNSYHIPAINQWAIRGFIHDVDPTFTNSVLINGYPKGAEAVTFVFVQALGSKFLNTLNPFYAPLGFFGIALLCQLFGATYRDSLAFGAIYLIIPANVIQYRSTYVDAALGSAVIALLALLASILVTNSRSWLTEAIPIGCAIGNVIAIKSSGVLIAALSVAMFLAWAMKGAHDRRKRLPDLLLLTSLSLVFATAVGGFWYLKNYVRHGSPLYPVGLSIAGHTVWPGETVAKAIAELPNTPPEIRALSRMRRVVVSWTTPLVTRPWSYPASSNPMPETDTRLGALGIYWILGCVPAVLACVFCLKRNAADDPQRKLMYYFLATSVPLAFLGTPMNWWARYTVWLFALGLPSVWIVLNVAQDFRSGARRLVRLGSGACISLLIFRAFVLMLSAGITSFADIKPGENSRPTLVFRSESPLLPLFPEMRSRTLTEILQTQSAVGIGPRELGLYAETIYGQLSIPIGRRNLVPVPEDVTESDVRTLHSDAHVQYIIWLTTCPIPSPLALHVKTRGSEGQFMYLEFVAESFQSFAPGYQSKVQSEPIGGR